VDVRAGSTTMHALGGSKVTPHDLLAQERPRRHVAAMRITLRPAASSLACLVVAFIAPSAVDAQARPQLIFSGATEANWIAPPGMPPDSFGVFHARRAFDLAAKPARFLVHVSADNRYRLYVNGTQVSSGPQRSDQMHWRYETVDLAPLLRAGSNVIAALVWNWGPNHPVAQHSRRTAFLVQGDGPSESIVNTGARWKLLRDSAYADVRVTGRDVGNAYYAAAHGESVDGARYPWGWERADFDDRGWYTVGAERGPAIVGNVLLHAVPGRGGFGDASGWQLEPRDLPPMEETPVRFAAVRRATGVPMANGFIRGGEALVVPANTRATLLLDHGRTTNAYTVLETSGGVGSTITLTYAEAAVDSSGRKGHRDEVEGRRIRGIRDVVRPGGGERRRFQSLYWRSGRYVELDVQTGADPLRVHEVSAIFTAYPFVERGRFASDLPWLADMWRMNWNGARIGAFETYMDTPYYEQLQYIGDTRLQALISLYVSGDDRLMRQAIAHFDDSRIPEGITTSRYPSELQQLIPPFALVYVAMVHDYHLHRSDPAFVRARLAGIRGILDWYGRRVDSTGMLGPMPYWNFVDWAERWGRGVPAGADDGHSATISLLYAYALDHAARLEVELGVIGMAESYRARADSLRRAARTRAWDAGRRLFRDSPDSAAFSQQTNVLAILTDAIPAAEQRALMERVLGDTTLVPASYYFAWYVHEALRKVGLADRYIEVLAPWRRMLALGLTSAPEKDEPTRSDSHAWAAHPNYGLLATVLGVRPASSGFRTVRIAPALGPLRTASGRVPHPRGDIEVSFTRAGASGLNGEVNLPAGLSGTIEWQGRSIPLREGRQPVRF
jgi:alpha-L-rhamnosidase